MCDTIDLFWQADFHRCRVPQAQAEGRGLCWTSTRYYNQTQVQGEAKGQDLFYLLFSLNDIYFVNNFL